MGVAGAGLATVISQGISAVLCLIYVIKKYPLLHITKEDLKLKLQSVGRLIAIGTPMGLQFSITAIGTIIVQVSLNKLGSSYIAAFTACSKIQDISTQPFPSLGVALATYTGQNAGAGRIDRVKKGLNASALMTLISSVIVMVLIFAFGNRMVGIFSKETSAAMLAHCHTFFYEVVWFYPFLSLIFIYRNALQGLGYGLLPMLGGVAELIARMIVIAILAAPFGFAGICWAHPVAWISALIPIIPAYYYYVKKQESKQLS
jgi:Na+-driven multidrug efflux pump